MPFYRPPLIVAAALAAAVSGCAGYRLDPGPRAAAARAAQPIDASAGIVIDGNTRNRWVEMWHDPRWRASWGPLCEELDFGTRLAGALRDAGLFRRVDYPARPDSELTLRGRFEAGYVMDPAMAPKAFLTGFFMFLPASIFVYHDAFEVSAQLSAEGASGRRQYQSRARTVAHSKVFSSGTRGTITAAARASMSHLLAELVERMIQDSEELKRLPRRGAAPPGESAAAEPPKAQEADREPAAATAPPAVAAPPAPWESAAAPPPPPQAPARPLSRAEILDLDRQILP